MRVLCRIGTKVPIARALPGPNFVSVYRATLDRSKLLFGRVLPGIACAPLDGSAGVRGEWIVPPGSPQRVVLYLHGGGYIGGSPQMYRGIASTFARSCSARVLVLDYRLAPEHPFPAAVEDAVAAYRLILDGGTPPGRVVVAGDSAGGGLTLSTLLALREAKLPLPAGAVLICPWVDLSASGESARTNARSDDIVVRDEREHKFARTYLNGLPLDHPPASGLFADLHGLPPLSIQASEIEILRDDATRLHAKARASGVDSTLRLWDGVPHVWHIFLRLPESREAFADIAAFVGRVTAG